MNSTINTDCILDPLGPLPPLDPIFNSEYSLDKSSSEPQRKNLVEINAVAENDISVRKVISNEEKYDRIKLSLLADLSDGEISNDKSELNLQTTDRKRLQDTISAHNLKKISNQSEQSKRAKNDEVSCEWNAKKDFCVTSSVTGRQSDSSNKRKKLAQALKAGIRQTSEKDDAECVVKLNVLKLERIEKYGGTIV